MKVTAKAWIYSAPSQCKKDSLLEQLSTLNLINKVLTKRVNL